MFSRVKLASAKGPGLWRIGQSGFGALRPRARGGGRERYWVVTIDPLPYKRPMQQHQADYAWLERESGLYERPFKTRREAAATLLAHLALRSQ